MSEHPWIKGGPYRGLEHTGMPIPDDPVVVKYINPNGKRLDVDCLAAAASTCHVGDYSFACTRNARTVVYAGRAKVNGDRCAKTVGSDTMKHKTMRCGFCGKKLQRPKTYKRVALCASHEKYRKEFVGEPTRETP